MKAPAKKKPAKKALAKKDPAKKRKPAAAEKKKGRKKVKRLPPGTPSPVDVHVGARVRQRRTLLGMSQESLGDAVGLTFQQIQKYERGANRIGASRLYEFSGILEVPVAHFFDDLPGELDTHEGRYAVGMRDQDQEADPLVRRETLEMVRAYYRIGGPRVRKRVFELIKTLGAAGGEEEED